MKREQLGNREEAGVLANKEQLIYSTASALAIFKLSRTEERERGISSYIRHTSKNHLVERQSQPKMQANVKKKSEKTTPNNSEFNHISQGPSSKTQHSTSYPPTAAQTYQPIPQPQLSTAQSLSHSRPRQDTPRKPSHYLGSSFPSPQPPLSLSYLIAE